MSAMDEVQEQSPTMKYSEQYAPLRQPAFISLLNYSDMWEKHRKDKD